MLQSQPKEGFVQDYVVAIGKALIERAIGEGDAADFFTEDQRFDALSYLESLSSEEQSSECDRLPRHILFQLYCANARKCQTYARRIKPLWNFRQQAEENPHLVQKIKAVHRAQDELRSFIGSAKSFFVKADRGKGKALLQRAVDEAKEKGAEMASRYTIEERVHIFAYLETLSFEQQEFELERLPDGLLLQLYCSNKQRPEEQARKIVYLTRLGEKAKRIQHLKAMLQDEIHRERAQERYENRWRGD